MKDCALLYHPRFVASTPQGPLRSLARPPRGVTWRASSSRSCGHHGVHAARGRCMLRRAAMRVGAVIRGAVRRHGLQLGPVASTRRTTSVRIMGMPRDTMQPYKRASEAEAYGCTPACTERVGWMTLWPVKRACRQRHAGLPAAHAMPVMP